MKLIIRVKFDDFVKPLYFNQVDLEINSPYFLYKFRKLRTRIVNNITK